MAENYYEVDHGYRALKAQLRMLDRSYTKVGLPEGGETHGRLDYEKLVQAAHTNEFGYEPMKIPERSFIRSAADENAGEILAWQERSVDKILGLRSTVPAELEAIGESMKVRIQHKIQAGPFAPNADYTVQKKGHDMPLVETGQLFESIQHKEHISGMTAGV